MPTPENRAIQLQLRRALGLLRPAQLDPDGAEIYVDCNFGELKLYFPKEWKLVDKLKTTLGSVRNDLRAGSAPDGPEVLLTGGTSFGSIEVLYI
jgi:hypothetical protein